MKLGSLFSGIGGFELGGLLAGIEPRWLSEIEPFAVLVTHKRLPGVKQYGDVCRLNGAELEPVDIITFGFPCFPKGTLVLTEDGYVSIEEIEIGMKVLTHKGRWRKVTATGAKYGETVVLKGNHYGLECTPNHPIYSSGGQTEKKTWLPAEEMKGRLWAVPKTAESLPVPMPLVSEDIFYVAGRWLCASEDKESVLRELGEWLTDRFGKRIPGWVFGMRESCRASLLRGIFDSENSRIEGNAWQIRTESKRLAESIRLLGEVQGYTTAVHQRDMYVVTIMPSEHMLSFFTETSCLSSGIRVMLSRTGLNSKETEKIYRVCTLPRSPSISSKDSLRFSPMKAMLSSPRVLGLAQRFEISSEFYNKAIQLML